MWDFAVTTEQKANKDYNCEASAWLGNYPSDAFDKLDLAIIARAESENNKILKGVMYTKTTGKFEGEFTVFRARIDLNDICIKHHIYDE